MFQLTENQAFIPTIAMLICISIFIAALIYSWKMKPEDADRYASMALKDGNAETL